MPTDFGVSGNPDSFYAEGYKASVDIPAWLMKRGLTCYEYQCTHGVRIGEKTARQIGENAQKSGIKLSIHAPYYISLASEDPQTMQNTKRHFFSSVQAATWMGADRVVFHMGGVGKQERNQAFLRAQRLFSQVLEELSSVDSKVYLAPETHGKRNQLGSLAEIFTLCQMSERVVPAIDFGHLYAVAGGGFADSTNYEAVFEQVAAQKDDSTAKTLHIHFSKLEFTQAGEKRHGTFTDPLGPPPEPLIQYIVKQGLTPRIICESAGTQAEDAMYMQQYYSKLLKV